MGTLLHERPCAQSLSVWPGEARSPAEAPWSCSRPDGARVQMGRRQRRLAPPPCTPAGQETHQVRKLQYRRRQKSGATASLQPSGSQVTSESKPQLPSLPGDERPGKGVGRCQAQRRHHLSTGGCRHTAAFPCHRRRDSSPDLRSEAADGDSDTDLSESERGWALPCGADPPALHLRPEVFQVPEGPAVSVKARLTNGGSDFPDFLPPPFNSWSLSQLALFYNTDGRGAPRPRPVGALERYLEKLLQLEWYQIQSVQEESGKSAVASAASCQRSVSTRLSAPKCILQCQRALALSFLSSLANHSALLSGCACTQCRLRYTSACGRSCCRASVSRQSRLSPLRSAGEGRVLPKRSYSESRVHAPGWAPSCRSPRRSSPVRADTHLKRMQASGNMRNPAAHLDSEAAACDPRVRGGPCGRRGGSEQRKRGADRKASETRRSKSECWRSAGKLRHADVKPDAVTAIMDNLPVAKFSSANRAKQVEFVT
ncbi:uncharacterized protein ACB058_005023 [Synchiropus picturatus]